MTEGGGQRTPLRPKGYAGQAEDGGQRRADSFSIQKSICFVEKIDNTHSDYFSCNSQAVWQIEQSISAESRFHASPHAKNRSSYARLLR
jgi:hypothetical protein